MRLRTTLQLASFFPIFMAALFIVYLFTVHLTVVVPGGGVSELPVTGAMVMAIFSLLVGWCFHRAGQNLVVQVGTLERMTERVKCGDLKTTNPRPGGKGEVAAVADVFSQMVVELRGYVSLIAAHEQLKRECDAALAAAARLRAAVVQASGTLELLRRAEQGIVTRMLDRDLFLLSWLPDRVVHAVLNVPGETHAAAMIRPDIQALLRKLITRAASPASAAGGDSEVALPKGVSVSEALDDTVLLCRWRWERERAHAPITITVDAGNAHPLEIQADRVDLVQAFASIMTNAAEAMPEGGSVAIELHTDSSGTLCISIADMGLGMSDAVRARCMKPFFSTKESKLGIGMTLAARVVTRCGGRMGVIGEKGKGATVFMTFPPPRTAATGKEAIRRGTLDVLLVDDDEATRDALATMLSKEGHHVTAVEDGAAAVLLLRKRRFDVVVTDLAMPLMSGEELAVAVKARHPSTPVVLVTASGEEMTQRNLQPEGVDAILSKPVLRYDLELAISKAMEQVDTVKSS